MSDLPTSIQPDRKKFAEDPFGYSAFAWHRWQFVREFAGYPSELDRPNSDELKSPVLWLSHAHAMTEAARVVLSSEPRFENMPELLRGICDSQFCATGLMLVGYSLEICLKAMLIIRKGIDGYTETERLHSHHRLEELADFVPNLTNKDLVILRTLTCFVTWAGRYPDPGKGRAGQVEQIFQAAEKFEIAGRDVFNLAARIMGHAKEVVDVED